MKKYLSLLLIIFIMFFAYIGIDLLSKNQLHKPYKIIFYDNGKEFYFDEGTETFKKILKETNNALRQSKSISLTQSFMKESDIKDIKENGAALEFVYSYRKFGRMTIDGKTHVITYSKILIPISSEKISKNIFIGSRKGFNTISLFPQGSPNFKGVLNN